MRRLGRRAFHSTLTSLRAHAFFCLFFVCSFFRVKAKCAVSGTTSPPPVSRRRAEPFFFFFLFLFVVCATLPACSMHQPPCRRRHRHDAFMLTCETTIPRPPRFPPFSLPQHATKHNTQLRRHVSLFFSAVSPRERLTATATATSTSTSPSRHDRSTPRRKLTIACTHRLKEKQKLTRAAGSSHYDGDAPPQSRASPNPI